ncbi:MAG: helix-turn-helix domain-containing protein [Bacteroidetes bacterium]|nr:helix-turn-helix domain-containing protein [Bacteroidota bacterium]
MAVIGSRLRELRQSRGIPLESIYERTRIPLETLRLLEDNQFSALPKVYVQSFLKSYCRELGIREPALTTLVQHYDRDDVVNSYFNPQTVTDVRETHPETQPVPVPDDRETPFRSDLPTEGETIQAGSAEKWFHKYKWVIAASFAALVGLFFIIDVFLGDDLKPEPPVAALDFNQVVRAVEQTPVTADSVVPRPVSAIRTSQKPADTLAKPVNRPLPAVRPISMDSLVSVPLRIVSGQDSTWIALTVDGQKAVAWTMPPNQTLTRTGRQFSLTLGRVQHTKVFLNGAQLTLPVTEGSMMNWVINGPVKKAQ